MGMGVYSILFLVLKKNSETGFKMAQQVSKKEEILYFNPVLEDLARRDIQQIA